MVLLLMIPGPLSRRAAVGRGLIEAQAHAGETPRAQAGQEITTRRLAPLRIGAETPRTTWKTQPLDLFRSEWSQRREPPSMEPLPDPFPNSARPWMARWPYGPPRG